MMNSKVTQPNDQISWRRDLPPDLVDESRTISGGSYRYVEYFILVGGLSSVRTVWCLALEIDQ